MLRRDAGAGRRAVRCHALSLALATGLGTAPSASLRSLQQSSPLPTEALHFGGFVARFDAGGTLSLEGEGWPPLSGTWTAEGSSLVLLASDGPEGCAGPGRYGFELRQGQLHLELLSDECRVRGMILHGSTWRPASEPETAPARRIVRDAAAEAGPLPAASDPAGSWPSFRGPGAAGVADGMLLPERWDGDTGEGVLWRTPIPGLAHSSPIVWSDRIFVTSAISSEAGASFRPGLYGDGDASEDRSVHRWTVTALDKHTGEVLWERVAHEGTPVNKRHIKSTYASSTPATDGRIVVAAFGSQGVYAYDVEGRFLWKVDVGRLDVGAYDVPTYEWGPASSPFIWNGRVYLQCDNQADSFVLALDLETGETLWKSDRDELPSWGTPNVLDGPSGPELVTNGSNLIRGYDPLTGEELWRLGGSSKITAPTPVAGPGLAIVASGRAPERPLFAVRLGARGDLTLPEGRTRSEAIAWSYQGRGPYMPTPLVYRERLYVLNNNGAFAAYDLGSGEELYRTRIPERGSGFSASPVAADGRIYLSSEDGDVIVVGTGPEFEHLATNPMGELLMATPAFSEGVLFVRGQSALFAVGRSR